MILQVFADTTQIVHDVQAKVLQTRTVTDAGQFEQLWRVDGARTQHDFAARFREVVGAAAAVLDADTATVFEDESLCQRAGDHREIRTLLCGTQKGLRGIPADTALLVDIEVADAGVVAAVEVIGGGDAGLLRGLREGLEDLPLQALFLYAPGAACAMRFAGAPVIVLAAFEDGKDGVPCPRWVVSQARPFVVVFALTAHVDHAVDRRTTAQHASTWV